MAEETQDEVVSKGPGAMLKERRESLRLSIEEIADKLHLRPAVVVELEDDIIDHKVSMTFTKGYVRLYAKHMDMDPEPLLVAFDELANPMKQPAKLQSFSQKMAKQASDKRLMMFSYFVLFFVVAMAVIWWFQQPEEPATVTIPSVETRTSEAEDTSLTATGDIDDFSQQTVTTIDAVEEQSTDPQFGGTFPASDIEEAELTGAEAPIAVDPQEDALSTASDGTFDLTEYDSSEPLFNTDVEGSFIDPESTEADAILEHTISELNAAELSSAGDNIAESVTGTQPVTQELIFTFAEDCWINLADATGENIAYGIKTAGRVMPVSGIPPFEVVIAQPQVVQLTVDGVPYDMSAFPAGRTARFVIGE